VLLCPADHPDALTFKDASQHGNHLHVGWVEGPGILGENLTLMADSSAEQDMPGGGQVQTCCAGRQHTVYCNCLWQGIIQVSWTPLTCPSCILCGASKTDL
jgi:hypothetical protein